MPPRPCALVVGMAGAGKSTLVQRLQHELDARGEAPLLVNLDPAVAGLPYEPRIDIRDSVNYLDLLRQHGWGPNGGILACLNVFAARIDELGDALAKAGDGAGPLVVDTPGQIECFTWSASGEIIASYLAARYATCLLYVVDAQRCMDPTVFVSTMIYACSLLYRFDLPMMIVFNKADLLPAGGGGAADAGEDVVEERDERGFSRPSEYVEDYLSLSAAFQRKQDAEPDSVSFAEPFHDSVAGVLEEFYSVIAHVEVSAMTGEGVSQLWGKLHDLTANCQPKGPPAGDGIRFQMDLDPRPTAAAPAVPNASGDHPEDADNLDGVD